MSEVELYLGDCLTVLPLLKDHSIDLIITSPPYADSRAQTYGGISPDAYCNWFLPISKELLRVLKPTGTFILNIKEKVVDGERHTYVMELILAMRKQGWFWTEEFIWHKKNSYPGKWPNRFRDSWERLLQFNKSRHFAMYQETVMVPVGDWSKTRLRNLSAIRYIQRMCCTWRRNAAIKSTAPLFPRPCRNGLSNFLQNRAIAYWILFLDRAQRQGWPINCTGMRLALR